MSQDNSDFSSVRRDYSTYVLDPDHLFACPIEQAKKWLNDAVKTEAQDPTSMVLSTVDADSKPDARVLLLKEIQPEGFVFYTHHGSAKGQQLQSNPCVALTFYWPIMVRQIRIRGKASLLSKQISDQYFATRPYLSQISAHASCQSQMLSNRTTLESDVVKLKAKYPMGEVPRPVDWGGYIVKPETVEFWQGRENRLHDRILYHQVDNEWYKKRLSP